MDPVENGRTACEKLVKDNRQFVVIENTPSSLEEMSGNLAVVKGDATAEVILIEAGIQKIYIERS